MNKWKKRLAAFGSALVVLGAVAGCGTDERVIQVPTSDIFTQDLNPPFLDILWMVDNRSGMRNAFDNLFRESKKFFSRLENATSAYRMAFVTADMEVRPAQVYPDSGPFGKSAAGETSEARATFFGNIVANSLDVNLKTGALNQGFRSFYSVLADPARFAPLAKVPLVLVLISDSDDESNDVPSGTDAVDFYEQRLLALKNNDRSLVRVYAVNYKPLPAGIAPNTSASFPYRCATKTNNKIDVKPAEYQDRYFKLAKRFATNVSNPELVTADLCKPFADSIDLSGLRLKELPKEFPLSKTPRPGTLSVTVVRKATGETFDIPWSYNTGSNELVFQTAPPEGTSVVATYFTD